MKKRTLSGNLRSQTAANQPNDFSNTHAQRYHRSHVEAARHFSNAYRVKDILPFWNRIYSSSSPTRILQILPNTQRTKEHLRATNFQVTKLFGVYQKDMPSVTSKLTARIPREFSEGRKNEKKWEGRKKETGWLYWPRWFCAIGLRPTIYFAALEEIAIASALLSRVIGAFGPGVCTLAVCRDCACVRTRAYDGCICVCVRLCAPTGWAGVCLRVHYVDCWSRPLRRT